MKKIYSKILACMLIALLAVSVVSIGTPVKAAGISPLAYYEMSFSCTGTGSVARGFDGVFLDVRVMATSNNNERVKLEVYVTNTNKMHTYYFDADGLTYEFKNIYLGLNGGSDVRFTFTANSTVNINMTAES